MLTVSRQSVKSTIARLKAGERLVVSDQTLDAIIELDSEFASEIRTAHNRQRVGVLDQYIAWVLDSAKPVDLTFVDHRAFATIGS